LARLPANRFTRRIFASIAAAGLLSRCAAVPDIRGLTPREVGLAGRRTEAEPAPISDADALQQQYDLQRALSAAPIVFGNAVTVAAERHGRVPGDLQGNRRGAKQRQPGILYTGGCPVQRGASFDAAAGSFAHGRQGQHDLRWVRIDGVVFNNEADAVILDHDTAAQVEAVLRRFMAASPEVDLARWVHRSLGTGG
jgi:hypothetical protein